MADDFISLDKDDEISLEKASPSITRFYVGAGWDESHPAHLPADESVDVDITAVCCKNDETGNPFLFPFSHATTESGKKYGNLVFFGNPNSRDDGGAVHHGGDNLTGSNRPELRGTPAENDDESIIIDFARMNPEIDEVALVLTINKAAEKGLTFKDAKNCFVRVAEINASGDLATLQPAQVAGGKPVPGGYYKPTEDFANFTAIWIASFVRKDGKWSFVAVGEGYVASFKDIVAQFTKG